jgi:ribosomal protein S18 acetylase RimI-like enzyme
MVDLDRRPCVYGSDLEEIVALVLAHRALAGVVAYPTLWRVRLLLTSRVGEPELDTRVWEDAAGAMAGLAFLWRRQPGSTYRVLDRFVNPSHASPDLAEEMLAWGSERATTIATERGVPLILYAPSLSPRNVAADPLEEIGFRPTIPSLGGHNVYFARALDGELPAPRLPTGAGIRPLRGLEELEAYQSMYGFSPVDAGHRQEQLASEEYAHLVVVEESGESIAYCECSIRGAEWVLGQGRIGWIDYVGVREDRQREGLGRAALLAGLAQLREWGADTAMVVTVSTNRPARGLYRRLGFEPVDVAEARSYEKTVPSG